MDNATFDIDKLERLEREATPGPWQADAVWDHEDEPTEAFCVGPGHEIDRRGDPRLLMDEEVAAFRAAERDAEFMSALRNAAPALFAELRAARERIEELERALRDLSRCGDSELHTSRGEVNGG